VNANMTSELREVAHNQHTHPTNRFYLIIGAVLIGLTVLEVLGYMGEVGGTLPRGMATIIILVLSALKFLLVVAMYMHLKFDHKLFTGIFVFPALLATLVIGGMIMLFGPIHDTSNAVKHQRTGPWQASTTSPGSHAPAAP
jgi:cytochrome c oxidase subunit 4